MTAWPARTSMLPQHAVQYDRDFFELGPLTGLFPALGREHASHAHVRLARIHAPRELLNELRIIARRFDDGGLSY